MTRSVARRTANVSAGTSIFAPAAGTVSRTWWDTFANGAGAGGWMIAINHGGGWETRVAHMREPSPLTPGDLVTLDSVIGEVGMTGAATGNHAHYEVLKDGEFVNAAAYTGSREGGQIGCTEMPFYLILKKKHTYLIVEQGSGKPRGVLMGSEGAGANRDAKLPVVHAHSAQFTADDINSAFVGIRSAHLAGFK